MTIDDAIVELDNPRDLVGQRLTFSASHDKLGLESAAVVVLREDMQAMVGALCDRTAATRRADVEVPPRVVFRARARSNGATGKLQHSYSAQTSVLA